MAYARKAVTRDSSGFTVSSLSVTLTSAMDFNAVTSGSSSATHFSVGTASSGTGKILFSGALDNAIPLQAGVTPRLGTGTTITASGGGNTFLNDLLKLIFQATAIANVADNAASGPLTSLYLALHTSDPGAGGSQTTNEVSY